MKLIVLVDNNTLIDHYFLGEPGLSFYIEDGGKKVLFDAAYSDAFIKNAKKLKIDLLDLDYIVISHGHLDHTWGLDSLAGLYTNAKCRGRRPKRPTLIAHPSVFARRKKGKMDIGARMSKAWAEQFFNLKLTSKPFRMTDSLCFLGRIPRKFAFEGKKSIGTIVGKGPDFIDDDTGLAYKSKKGLVIITGCAHAGICNTIAHAMDVCKDRRVADVIGGFHLLNAKREVLSKTVSFLSEIGPAMLHPCHCTDLNAKFAISEACKIREVGVDLRLKY